MTDQKKFNPIKVVATGAVIAAGTYTAVKLANKENREKVKKLVRKYTREGVVFAKKALNTAEKIYDAKKMITEEVPKVKKLAKKV